MSTAQSRSLILARATHREVAREVWRRVRERLLNLPDGRWTRMDFVFAAIVAFLALSSTGFFTAIYNTASADPEYFSRRLIAAMEASIVDPIETGTVALAAASDGVGPKGMPAPEVRRPQPLEPADYEIVMIFGDEALLATARELWRVKVGSVLPGLGTVLAIDTAANVVRSEKATLQMVAP